MSIESVLCNFREKLVMITGQDDPIGEISLDTRVYDFFAHELSKQLSYTNQDAIYQAKFINIMGIKIRRNEG